MVYYVPFARHRWNKIAPGLWMGGHQYDPIQKFSSHPQPAVVKREFDVVVSLFTMPDCGPADGVEHIVAEIDDGELKKGELLRIDALASLVALGVRSGKRVLVRCHAGYNRSGLVVALALMELGYTAEDAIDLIRKKRSKYALMNEHFVKYIEFFARLKEEVHAKN